MDRKVNRVMGWKSPETFGSEDPMELWPGRAYVLLWPGRAYVLLWPGKAYVLYVVFWG